MTACPKVGDLVEPAIDLVLTQYRESQKLLDLIRAGLSQVEEAARATCAVPTFFELETAVGEQLTFIGRRLGWPRCHCVCDVQPVHGFDCEGVVSDFPLLGFCEPDASWIECGVTGVSTICIEDDEVYRGFLLARRYQMLALFDRDSLQTALQYIWGETAVVLDEGYGRIVMAPGRPLTDQELNFLQLVPRVLPVAPGVRQRFHFGDVKVAGFGEGWGTGCEPWFPEGAQLETEHGVLILGNDGVEDHAITTGTLTRGAPLMCEVDVFPYECPPAPLVTNN